ISKKLIALFIVISGILAIILWNFVLLTYQKTRVLVFLHLEHSSLGAGYNIIQSKITLGSGGFIGNLFSGSQLRLGFLPEAHTDFIFSSYGNALGFLGVAILLSLYLFLIFKIFYTGFQFEDNFIKLSVLSIGFSVFIYSFINILMDIGAIPVVGVPLPLVSFGGSNIIMIMGYFGFVLAAKKEFLKSKVI
ncbi:MAG: FtsW/RodA/SpoVE family cell cycle protein, partial [Psittacicella sp.]